MVPHVLDQVDSFAERIRLEGIDFSRRELQILQVNIGKRCNQACRHCHVDSSPIRTENMTRQTIERLLELLQDAPRHERVLPIAATGHVARVVVERDHDRLRERARRRCC